MVEHTENRLRELALVELRQEEELLPYHPVEGQGELDPSLEEEPVVPSSLEMHL